MLLIFEIVIAGSYTSKTSGATTGKHVGKIQENNDTTTKWKADAKVN